MPNKYTLPANAKGVGKPTSEAQLAATNGYAALVNALREAVLRLEEWGPGPADAFWINEVANPLIEKYSKPHTVNSTN